MSERRNVSKERLGLIGSELDSIEKRFGAIEDSIVSLETEMRTHNAMGVGIEQKITTLQDDVKAVAGVTTEVRDILTTFKTLGTFAKWSSGIVAAILGLFAALKGYFK